MELEETLLPGVGVPGRLRAGRVTGPVLTRFADVRALRAAA